jgi:hypothetical protein
MILKKMPLSRENLWTKEDAWKFQVHEGYYKMQVDE